MERILKKDKKHTDGLLTTNLHHQIYQVSGNTIQDHEPHWDYEDHVGQAKMKHVTCVSEGMKRYTVKPVNHEVQEVTQKQDKNPALFLSWKAGSFRK